MANKILLEVVTPSKLLVSEEVELATAPGADGVFGAMANHAPLLATLKIGEAVGPGHLLYLQPAREPGWNQRSRR